MATWIFGIVGAASVISAAVFVVSIFQLLIMIHRRLKAGKHHVLPVASGGGTKGKESLVKGAVRGHVLSFTLQEVELLSEGFSNLIGQGSTNRVYKGILSDGMEVAVKKLKQDVAECSDVEASFRFQMELLSRVHHQHLANLVGICDEKQERMLLFQYAPNGTLFENLHTGDENLSWKQRMRIIVGAAYGLAYLHHLCNPPVIHGDLRSRNILLTEDFAAKITGLGRVPIAGSSELALVRKTGGYVDPEIVHRGVYSRAGDVFSFGVLLLEVLSGKQAFSEETGMLVEWAQQFLQSRDRMMDLVDKSMSNVCPMELYSVCELARLCTQRESSSRPSMRDVSDLLVQSLAIPAEAAAPVSSPVTLRGLMEG
ncbi:protein MALE DISCOVERER 2 [Selaginella moellendorffii]|nr:protein MALE DISCOVERER 2 [Selaginella moellendorffii]|eukprot:XP_002986220.2 protein MALE DISCOVERER 2 [Selaginella moellendorffii]